MLATGSNCAVPPQIVQQTLGHQSLHTPIRYAHARPIDSSGLNTSCLRIK